MAWLSADFDSKALHMPVSVDILMQQGHVKKCFEEMPNKYDYTYDQIEGIGHVWPFWEEELDRYLNHLKLPIL